jgi:hypothetical protein
MPILLYVDFKVFLLVISVQKVMISHQKQKCEMRAKFNIMILLYALVVDDSLQLFHRTNMYIIIVKQFFLRPVELVYSTISTI